MFVSGYINIDGHFLFLKYKCRIKQTSLFIFLVTPSGSLPYCLVFMKGDVLIKVVCSILSFKGELKSEISLLYMKVLTLIKAKSNVFPWYVQCCSCTRRSKTKILTTRALPSWIEFDVVTSHRQMPHLEYGLWLLISMFLRLLVSCKSQKNRLRVSSNRFK